MRKLISKLDALTGTAKGTTDKSQPASKTTATRKKSLNESQIIGGQVDEVSAAAMGRAAEREYANQDFDTPVAAPTQRQQPIMQNRQEQRKVYIVMKGSNKKVGQAYTNFNDAQRARAKMRNPEQYGMIKEDGTPISEKKIMELSKKMLKSRAKKTNESKSRRTFKVIAEGAEFNVSDSDLARVLKRFPHEVKVFKDGGDLGDALYDALFDYYLTTGEMPYGTMKARDGDPYEWVTQQLDRDISYDSGLTEDSSANSEIESILKKYPYEARQFREFGELDGTPISEKKIMELSKKMLKSRAKKTNESKSRRTFKVIAEGAEFNVSDSDLARVLKRFPHEVKVFKDGGDLGDALYDALFDYYLTTGEMPYGTMKARDGDPYEWVTQQLDRDISYDSGLTEDSSANSEIESILKKYPYEARQFREFGELDDNEMYQELFDHYLNSGEMPYGVAKARTGDPVQWVANRLEKDIGLNDINDDSGHTDSARKLSSHDEDYTAEGMGGDVMSLESSGDEMDESMLMDDQEQAVTHKLSSLGYDEGLDFFFENGELTVIGKSTAIAIVNALKADGSIDGSPSITRIDGEEIHISFNSGLGESLADDFAAMANSMKNKDGSQRFNARAVTPDQKRQERDDLDAKRAAERASRPPVAPGRVTTNNGSFDDSRGYGQGRYMGDSKINKGKMLKEDAALSLDVSGTDDVLAVLRKLSGLPGDDASTTDMSPDVSADDFSGDSSVVDIDDINQEPSMRGMIDMMSDEPESEVVPELAADAVAPEVEVEEEYANEPDETILPGYGSACGDKDRQGRAYKMTSPGNNPMAETRSLMRQYKGMLSSIKK